MTTDRALRLMPLAFLLASTFAQDAGKPALAKSGTTAVKKAPAPTAHPLEPGLYANIVTSMGTIKAKLFEKESPITVKNFQDLATGKKPWTDPKTGQRVTRPLYSGTIFHRVIPGFMIQGGDPTGTGMGGSDPIPDELSPSLSFNQPGRLAMANTGQPGTGSSQFFITEVPTPHLDGRHTIFGQVVQNQELVTKIAGVPKNGEKPITPVRILRITFQKVPAPGATPAKPTSTPKPAGTPAPSTPTRKAPSNSTRQPAAAPKS
ncbi:MAG TPA: peptidylprolyl isomerase [Bryobacteraceae bacterium]|nr:peptidylprolyl isomerase [Bryobacteraceae bacterium]